MEVGLVWDVGQRQSCLDVRLWEVVGYFGCRQVIVWVLQFFFNVFIIEFFEVLVILIVRVEEN